MTYCNSPPRYAPAPFATSAARYSAFSAHAIKGSPPRSLPTVSGQQPLHAACYRRQETDSFRPRGPPRPARGTQLGEHRGRPLMFLAIFAQLWAPCWPPGKQVCGAETTQLAEETATTRSPLVYASIGCVTRSVVHRRPSRRPPARTAASGSRICTLRARPCSVCSIPLRRVLWRMHANV